MNTEELNSGDPGGRGKARRRRWRRWFLVVVAVLVALRFTVLTNRRVSLEIAPDTTVITGPLNADGTVNYVAYLNEQRSKGVTSETNAAAAMILLSGLDVYLPDEVYRLMGVDPKQRYKSPRFKPFDQFLPDYSVEDARYNAQENYGRAMERPWRSTEFPIVHGFLQANAKVLDAAVVALDRPHWYWPLVSSEDPPTLTLSRNGSCNKIALALVSRAMLRAGTGDLEGCLNDLIAVRRLAGFRASKEGSFVRLFAAGISRLAYEAEFALLSGRKLSDVQVRSYLGRREAMAPWPSLARIVDVSGRLSMLDHAMQWRRKGFSNPFVAESAGYTEWLFSTPLDDNMVLRRINLAYDRFVSAFEIPDLRRRQEAFAQLDREYEAMTDRLIPTPIAALTFARLIGHPGQGTLSKHLADLQPVLVHMDLNYMKMVHRTDLHGRVCESIVHCGLRLEVYRTEQGRYPADAKAAGAIMPAGKLPNDPFDPDGGVLIYRRQGDGYILYSRGENETDDGGAPSDDSREGDIVLRVGAATTQPAGTPVTGDE